MPICSPGDAAPFRKSALQIFSTALHHLHPNSRILSEGQIQFRPMARQNPPVLRSPESACSRTEQPLSADRGRKRSNTLDLASKIVCHETAGLIGFFPPRRALPSIGCLPPRQLCRLWKPPPRERCPLWIPQPTERSSPLLDDPEPKELPSLWNPSSF